ncbi:MAG: hypothetical protein HY718_21450 [Planctomycetes bacterium]|nr:hypothetical protein [Planctomycetota bacterium]
MNDSVSAPSSSKATLVKVGFIVIAVGGAIYFAGFRGRNEYAQLDTPDSAEPYGCVECGHVFNVTPAEFERLGKSGGIQSVREEGRRGRMRLRCPQCGKFGGAPALRCPNDGTTFASGGGTGRPIKCPKCGWSP